MSANLAGSTKKAAAFTLYNAFSSVGNIVGPYLYRSEDAPDCKLVVGQAIALLPVMIRHCELTMAPATDYPGLKATLAIFCVLVFVIALQVVNLSYLNRRKEAQRVANGKPAKLRDLSMTNKYEAAVVDETKAHGTGELAFADLTDKENDEFIYLL